MTAHSQDVFEAFVLRMSKDVIARKLSDLGRATVFAVYHSFPFTSSSSWYSRYVVGRVIMICARSESHHLPSGP